MEKNENKTEEELGKGAKDIQNLKKRLTKNASDIHISRVPKQTKIDFIDLANKEFAGDYGMLIKWLMDDLISPDTKELIAQLSELNERVTILEQTLVSVQTKDEKKEKKENTATMLSGKERRIKK